MSENLNFEKHSVLWPHREWSQRIETKTCLWHVQKAGQGPPLLLLHGTGASTHTWAGLFSLLAKHYTLIVPDLPGQGFTKTLNKNCYSIKEMAKALSDLLQQLNIIPTIAIGHSAGAAVLVRMALDAQIKPLSIISVNGAFFPFGGTLTSLFSPLAKMLALNPLVPHFFTWGARDRSSVKRLLDSTGSTVPEKSVDLYQRLFRCPSHVSATLAMMASWDLETLLKDIPSLRVPLLLIVGENDQTINPEDGTRLTHIVRGSTLEHLPHLGHLAHEEDPQKVAQTILRHLKQTNIL